MRRRPRPTKEAIARQVRWRRVHLPRVQQATPPNAEFLTQPTVLAALQHLAHAINVVLMARPLAPFPWLADYLRHACKVAYSVEVDPAAVLTLEMHKKRRVIQNALLDTKADQVESKQLIRDIVLQQTTLSLSDEELRLTDEDHEFLVTRSPHRQSLWSVDVNAIPLPTCDVSEAAHAIADAWVAKHLSTQRHIDEYASLVRHGVTHALVGMELATPENAAEWLVLHFKTYESTAVAVASSAAISLLFRTNYELMRKIEALKRAQQEMHERRERLDGIQRQLEGEIATRDRFIHKLRVMNTTARTHAIMNGTPCFLNAQKVWILPGSLLDPEQLTRTEQQGLQRAERTLMEEDETRWRFLLTSQKRFDAATQLQAAWRCSRDYRAFEDLKLKRRNAAIVIQRNYFHYLYHRAISLPPWCVIGREVVVAPSVALRSAITFQFYPQKDFPTGNIKRIDGMSVIEMMEICRREEGYVAFSTDGAFKRFVPRKLSQLQEMVATRTWSLTMADGIYIKTFPSKADTIMSTGIIAEVPVDRFGLITVVLDGTGCSEQVALQKLSDRWKKVRIRRRRQREKKRRTLVFGGTKVVENLAVDGGASRCSPEDYEVLDDESEENELRRRRRVRVQSNEREAKDPLVDFVYEDQSTKEVRETEPHCTYEDADERSQVIATRQQEYARMKAVEYEAKKLQSVVRLQCAWRSKRAREAFRQVLQLRAKEKERDRLVTAVHATNQQKIDQRRAKKNASKPGFFSKWLRR